MVAEDLRILGGKFSPILVILKLIFKLADPFGKAFKKEFATQLSRDQNPRAIE